MGKKRGAEMKHLFIVNPRAGRGNPIHHLIDQAQAQFAPGEYRLLYTNHPNHAQELACEAAQSGEEVRLYACGGDGTLNEVVNGAAGYPNAAVTHFPLGTGNDFLRIFGADLPRFRQVDQLKNGPQAAFDLMDCNGRLGLDIVCAGVDARVAADVHNYTTFPLVTGGGAYILSLAANVLFRDIARPMTVTVNGETWDQDTTILCVCNGRYYGGGFMPVGEAMPDDGLFEVLLVPRVSRRTFLRLVGQYAKGRYADYPQLIQFHRTTQLTFSTPQSSTVVVDGEIMEGKEFTLRLSEKKVNFFYPQGASYQPGKLPGGAKP